MGYQMKSYKKFVATAATATLVASAIVPVASAAAFTDVEETNSFATYINAAVEAGYIKGYEDGTFRPNNKLTRGQVVKIMGRYLESLGYDSAATTAPWSDVTDAELIKYGNIVKDTEVFKGFADGTLKGNDFITRENMAIVLDRLAKKVTNGTSLSDLAKEIEDVKIADLETANANYRDAIQALRDLEISTVDNFNPKGDVTRGQFAKFIMNTVETIDAEVAPEVTVEDIKKEIEAVDAKLPAVKDITADNAEAAKVAVEAAKTAIAAIEEKIKVTGLTGEEVAELNKAIDAVEAKFALIVEAADKAIEAAKQLAVESVSAINTLKVITVEFTAPVDAETVTTSTVTLTKGNSNALAGSGIVLSEDGKTLKLVVAPHAQSNEYKLVLNGIKGEDGADLAKYETTVTTVDTVAPELASVQVLNSKKLKVVTSEPIATPNTSGAYQILTSIKVDGVSVPVKATPSASENEVYLDFGSSITVGDHKLALSDFVDFAGFKSAAKELSFTVVEDKTAPSIVSAEDLDKNTVKVKFSEPVQNLGTITINGQTFTSATKVSADQTEYTFTLANALGLANLVETKVTYVNTTDAEGNKVEKAVDYVFKAKDDQTKPTISSVELKAGNVVAVAFSKTLSTGGTVTVKDANGKVVADKVAVTLNATKDGASITGSTIGITSAGGTYTLEFSGAKDASIRGNEAVASTFTVVAKDAKAPTASAVAGTPTATTKSATIYFDEAMDAATLVKSNFVINGKNLADISKSTLTVADDNKSVVITVPVAETLTQVTVLRVTDVAGNVLSNTNTPISVDAAPTLEAITSAYATGANQVSIVVPKNSAGKQVSIASIDPSSFSVIKGGTPIAVATSATVVYNSDDTTTINLTLNTAIAELTKQDNYAKVVIEDNGKTYDIYGNDLVAAGVDIKDEVRPTVTSIVAGNTIDENQVTEANTFTLSLTEALDLSEYIDLENALIVTGTGSKGAVQLTAGDDYKVVASTDSNNVDADQYVVELTSTGYGKINSGTLTVQVLPTLEDKADNKVNPYTTTLTVTIDEDKAVKDYFAQNSVTFANAKFTIKNVDGLTSVAKSTLNGKWYMDAEITFNTATTLSTAVTVNGTLKTTFAAGEKVLLSTLLGAANGDEFTEAGFTSSEFDFATADFADKVAPSTPLNITVASVLVNKADATVVKKSTKTANATWTTPASL